jgi:hypothetical protein
LDIFGKHNGDWLVLWIVNGDFLLPFKLDAAILELPQFGGIFRWGQGRLDLPSGNLT